MTEPAAPLPVPHSLDAALERIARDHAAVTATEEVALRDALGRILAEDVASPVDVPPCAVSAMDGYGLATGGQPVAAGSRFALVGRVPAGSLFDATVRPGEAVRIFTGAPVPAGVDVVAIQEECAAEDGAVVVTAAQPLDANIRHAGEDMRAGTVVLPAGRRLRPQEVGLAASVGRRRLTVRTRLRVVLFSTGDELREPGAPKPAGTIYDANRHALFAQLAALGLDVEDLGILPDRQDAVRAALQAAAAGGAHLIVTSGGASVGEEDHVRAAVTELGRIDLWRLALRPGKPLAIGRVADTVVLGLPGNPVSALVTFMLLGRPLALRLAGAERCFTPSALVVCGFDFRKKPGRREFLRARIETGPDGRPVAKKFRADGSNLLTSMTESDGLVDVPAETETIKAGELVAFLPFTGLYD